MLTGLLPVLLAGSEPTGATPALGWNSWNFFREELNETVVKDTADALIATGLAKKGYTYVNMDDTWAAGRDATGALYPVGSKFPNGIPALASYVHARGLKFGIYTDVGHKTCAKAPGTWGHEETDAKTFAAWGVDFVKSDSCFTDDDPAFQPANGTNCQQRYRLFDGFLRATGRAMVHSVKGPCGRQPYQECSVFDASGYANLRRTSGDAKDDWASVMRILHDAAGVAALSRPGYFADMDIMEIGNGGLTDAEERTEMALWCAIKSPLLLGNDLTHISAERLAIVGNEALLAVNQDPLGKAALRVSFTPNVSQIWAGPLAGDEAVVVLLNAAAGNATVAATWEMLRPALPSCVDLVATCLWTNKTAAFTTAGPAPSALLQSHASAALRLACKGATEAGRGGGV